MATCCINNGPPNAFICLLAIQSFNKDHVLGILLGPGDLRVDKMHIILVSKSFLQRKNRGTNTTAIENVLQF